MQDQQHDTGKGCRVRKVSFWTSMDYLVKAIKPAIGSSARFGGDLPVPM